MRRAGYHTWVGGNIGDVLLDVLPKIRPSDRVVMELSSFQLELMTFSPEIGAVLNITRERVRQIKEKALSRLRHVSRARALESYLG